MKPLIQILRAGHGRYYSIHNTPHYRIGQLKDRQQTEMLDKYTTQAPADERHE